jgi:hypothetical protein
VRRIHVEHGLSLRFTGRDEEFNEGVEIGILVGLMSSGRTGTRRSRRSSNPIRAATRLVARIQGAGTSPLGLDYTRGS